MTTTMTFNEPTKALMSRLIQAGGFPYVVGGAVRDFVRRGKHYGGDIDIEVFGLNTLKIGLALEGLDFDAVGRSFAVWKVKIDGQEFDVSLPRKEEKTGVGHLGFTVTEIPHATVREAASRRDFTINAMMAAPDGTIVDPFGGRADLERGVLRHVSKAFSEDPLRVLRGAQFAARFNMTMDEDTKHLCHMLISEFGTISKERIWHEFHKMLEATRTDLGFDVLQQTAWSMHFPNFSALFDRNVRYCVTAHGSIEMKLALCLREAPQEHLKAAMKEIDVPHSIQKKVLALHKASAVYETFSGNVAQLARALDRLGLSLHDLTRFRSLNPRTTPVALSILSYAKNLGVFHGPLKNVVTGDLLISMGFKPGPSFGAVLNEMEEIQDAGFFTADNAEEMVRRCMMKHGGGERPHSEYINVLLKAWDVT